MSHERPSLLAPFRDTSHQENPFALSDDNSEQDLGWDQGLSRGGEEPQVEEVGLDSAPRPRRSFGWTANDGIKGLIKYAANPTKRVPTGIWPIDNMIGGGVGRGEVALIVGKSGSGKSIIGQNILESNLDVPCVFFSFEMPGTMLMTRSIAMWSNRTHDQVFGMVENNNLDLNLLEDWTDSHRKHFYVTRTGLDLAAMTQSLVEAEEAIGERPAMVIIDYMELVAAVSGGDTIDNVTSVAQQLKGWAKQEEVSCIVLHQTNKSLRHGDAPDDDAARYGGFTEADIVIGVWRPHKWEPKVKGDVAITDIAKTYLRGFFGINLIKNRPKIELHEQGYLVAVSPSGKLDNLKGKQLINVTPGGAGPF